MIELYILGFITFVIFAVAFYQSFRDKARWNRISSGMSLFGEREDIPPLELDGATYQPHERRVIIIWGNLRHTAVETVTDAKKKDRKRKQIEQRSRARGEDICLGRRNLAPAQMNGELTSPCRVT